MKKTYRAVGAAALAVMLMAGCGTQNSETAEIAVPSQITVTDQEDNRKVTVESRETVKVTPDVAEVVFRVHTEAKDAEECQTQNGEALSSTLEYLKGLGLEDGSIQTSDYRLNPMYEWPDDGGRVLSGYEMDTRITVSGVPMDQVGSVLSGTVAAGADSVDSVRYFCSAYDEGYQEALKKAMESAKVKAEAMGDAGDFQVLEVLEAEEHGENQAARYVSKNISAAPGAAAGAAAAADSAMSVEAGELEIEANVTVTFRIY